MIEELLKTGHGIIQLMSVPVTFCDRDRDRDPFLYMLLDTVLGMFHLMFVPVTLCDSDSDSGSGSNNDMASYMSTRYGMFHLMLVPVTLCDRDRDPDPDRHVTVTGTVQ